MTMIIENTLAPAAYAAAVAGSSGGTNIAPLVKGLLIGGFSVAVIIYIIWMISEYEKDQRPIHPV